MGRRESLDADIFQPLWAAGWQWLWIVAGGVFLGGYLAIEFGDLLQGVGIIAASGALAALGIWYVNGRYEAVLDAGIDQAQTAVLDLTGLDTDSDVSSIPDEGGELLLVTPARAYELTTLVAGADAFVVHDDARVSLAHRYVSVDDDADRFEYASLSSVTFEDGELHVALTDGTTESYAMDAEPTGALSAVTDRLAAFGRAD